MALEAYSPLGTGRHLRDPEVARIAERTGRTPAQVLLRWCLQRDLVVIPKSTHRERIEENAQIFDFTLSDEDMAELDALDRTGGTDRGPRTEVVVRRAALLGCLALALTPGIGGAVSASTAAPVPYMGWNTYYGVGGVFGERRFWAAGRGLAGGGGGGGHPSGGVFFGGAAGESDTRGDWG